MFYTRFLFPANHKCTESSTFDSSSIIAHPGKQWERSLKCDAKNYTHTHTHTHRRTRKRTRTRTRTHARIYIYHPLDNRYGFSISVQFLRLHHFPQFLFKSWQVCDWLAKWLLVITMILLGIMDLRWPRVARRSNVGLVYSSDSLFDS